MRFDVRLASRFPGLTRTLRRQHKINMFLVAVIGSAVVLSKSQSQFLVIKWCVANFVTSKLVVLKYYSLTCAVICFMKTDTLCCWTSGGFCACFVCSFLLGWQSQTPILPHTVYLSLSLVLFSPHVFLPPPPLSLCRRHRPLSSIMQWMGLRYPTTTIFPPHHPSCVWSASPQCISANVSTDYDIIWACVPVGCMRDLFEV